MAGDEDGDHARNMMGGFAALVLIDMLVLVWVGSRIITKPIVDLTEKMRALAADDTSIVLEGTDRKTRSAPSPAPSTCSAGTRSRRHKLEAENAEAQAPGSTAGRARSTPSSAASRSEPHLIESASRASTISRGLAGAHQRGDRERDPGAFGARHLGQGVVQVQSVASAAEELTSSIGRDRPSGRRNLADDRQGGGDARTTNAKIEASRRRRTGSATWCSHRGDRRPDQPARPQRPPSRRRGG